MRTTPLRDDELRSAPATLRGRALCFAPSRLPSLPRARGPSSAAARYRQTPVLRASEKGGRGRGGEGSPLPTAPGGSDMMTAGREGGGHPVPGVEPPGGWSLAAPPEPPARSAACEVVAAGAARPPPAPGAPARHPRPGPPAPGTCSPPGALRAPQVRGRPPSFARRAAPGGKTSPEPAPPWRCRPPARCGGEARDRQPPPGRAGEAGGGLRIQVPWVSPAARTRGVSPAAAENIPGACGPPLCGELCPRRGFRGNGGATAAQPRRAPSAAPGGRAAPSTLPSALARLAVAEDGRAARLPREWAGAFPARCRLPGGAAPQRARHAPAGPERRSSLAGRWWRLLRAPYPGVRELGRGAVCLPGDVLTCCGNAAFHLSLMFINIIKPN